MESLEQELQKYQHTNKKAIKKMFRITMQELFKISLIAFLFLVLIDAIDENFISFIFNINLVLGLVLVSGLLTWLVTSEPKSQ